MPAVAVSAEAIAPCRTERLAGTPFFNGWRLRGTGIPHFFTEYNAPSLRTLAMLKSSVSFDPRTQGQWSSQRGFGRSSGNYDSAVCDRAFVGIDRRAFLLAFGNLAVGTDAGVGRGSHSITPYANRPSLQNWGGCVDIFKSGLAARRVSATCRARIETSNDLQL
jgi:hypothetical protein